jgi:hypothetical protein
MWHKNWQLSPFSPLLFDAMTDLTFRSAANIEELTQTASIQHTLWVDRYRPKKYTELLGDERVHREVLSWLKEWDRCVFGKNNKVRGKKRDRDGEQEVKYQDEYHRPREKVDMDKCTSNNR